MYTDPLPNPLNELMDPDVSLVIPKDTSQCEEFDATLELWLSDPDCCAG